MGKIFHVYFCVCGRQEVCDKGRPDHERLSIHGWEEGVMDLIEIWIMAMLGLSAVLAVGAAWMEVWGCGHAD